MYKYYSIILCALFIRGESFRHILLLIGEVRSLLPGVKMMALTATVDVRHTY